ncbi:MAG TPA: helix-turn-helix domain-containing protein [bacterium]|nr:helix-turn-helix domain-containing protein [bacterium]
MTLILALGAFPGILFALIKIFNRNEDLSNRILGIAIFFYSTMLLLVFLGKYSYLNYSKEFIVVANTFISVSWPLFYLYILLITGATDRLSRKDAFHFAALTGYAALFVVPVVLMNDLSDLFFRLSFFYSLTVSSVYSILMLLRIRTYKNTRLHYSAEDEPTFSWLQASVLLWLFIDALQFIFVPLRPHLIACCPLIPVVHEFTLYAAATSWIYLFAYFAFSHPDIFSQSRKMASSLQEEKAPPSPLNEEYAQTIAARLEKVMKEQKPYLDLDLTIATLADLVHVPPYLLGRYLNLRLGKNFMTYINELRVEEVKSRFMDPALDNTTILEISLQAGFRTKSAFNNFFKRSTGMTPTEYRRSLKNQK